MGRNVEKRGFPRGQTTASRMKALFAQFEAVRGRAEAEAWLGVVRIRPAEIEDETRLLPLIALCRALDAYVEALGATAIADAAPRFLAKDNLGLWARVLRAALTPEAAFLRLDGTESEYGRTTLWETLASRPGLWRGRVRLAHDPRLEESGHLALLRAAELSVVPCLFGHARAVVARSGGDSLQEYAVEWPLPLPKRRATAFGAVLGAATGALSGAALGALPSLAAAAVAGALGAGAGQIAAREIAGKREARAQAIRVAALERSLVLKELRESGSAGDLVGTMVAGQYRLGKSMGSGATGGIYQAVRVSDELPVAVKLLRAGAAHDTVASDRLRREAEALGLAWHPNVVEALDHGHLPDGSAYLVMELLRGQSLADRLRERGGRLPPEELYPIALVLAEALVAIHAAGVIHRDLKPDNLFLVRAEDPGDPEIVKILDFGIARVEWEEMRITNLGAPMGTAGYMAPEQEAGADVDARADLYALGATLHECLFGETPSPEATGANAALTLDGLDAKLQTLTPAEPHPGSGVHRSASAAPGHAWSAVLERCLARSPDARFPDARALARALRAMAEGVRHVDER